MATKWKGAYDSSRRYSKVWESKHSWVAKASDGSENAFCKVCHVTIQPRASNLSNHEKTTKHIQRINASNSTMPLQVIRVPRVRDEVKIGEIELAVTMACHSAVMTINHLGTVISRNASGSKLEHIKLHRSKCTKILTNVVAPALKEELVADIKGKKFALIVDDSTDVATMKQLCVIVRYYSDFEKKIVTAFVDLISVVHTRADDLFNAIKDCVTGIELRMEACVAFGSDGVAVMVGEHDSVWTRILTVSPQCVQLKCICHSLALCVKHAFEKLPSSLGFLLAEIPKWFSKSTIRREDFKTLYDTMNPDDDEKPPFERHSTTRWPVRGKLIFNILVNWEELKVYFMTAETSSTQAARYKARLILAMLKDPIVYLYFHFVSPLITEFDRVNAFFQATDADPEEMHKELAAHNKSLCARVFDEQGNQLQIEKVDFGGKFQFEANNYISTQTSKPDAASKVHEMKRRCLTFLLELVRQVQQRLPATTNIFKGLSNLHPSKVLDAKRRASFDQLPFPHLRDAESVLIEQQYRRILRWEWTEEPVFNGIIPQDTALFWSGILQYQNSLGQKSFQELAKYALNCLKNPVSNAVVERIFSLVTSIKSKQRNRMGNELLNAVVRIFEASYILARIVV